MIKIYIFFKLLTIDKALDKKQVIDFNQQKASNKIVINCPKIFEDSLFFPPFSHSFYYIINLLLKIIKVEAFLY